MSDTQALTIAASLVASLFGVLVMVLGWIGSRIYSKLEEMGKTMHDLAGDLHERINVLEQRVTVVETTQRVKG
jgi:hypothetical protein